MDKRMYEKNYQMILSPVMIETLATMAGNYFEMREKDMELWRKGPELALTAGYLLELLKEKQSEKPDLTGLELKRMEWLVETSPEEISDLFVRSGLSGLRGDTDE